MLYRGFLYVLSTEKHKKARIYFINLVLTYRRILLFQILSPFQCTLAYFYLVKLLFQYRLTPQIFQPFCLRFSTRQI